MQRTELGECGLKRVLGPGMKVFSLISVFSTSSPLKICFEIPSYEHI